MLKMYEGLINEYPGDVKLQNEYNQWKGKEDILVELYNRIGFGIEYSNRVK
jgi:hypothetical protein